MGVENRPAARIAQQGVTPDNFPVGTILTVSLNPLRDGRTFGAMPNGTGLINCGKALPAGGCNAETGKTYLAENNYNKRGSNHARSDPRRLLHRHRGPRAQPGGTTLRRC